MKSFPERLAALQPFWGSWYLDELLGKGSYGEVYRIKKEDRLGETAYAALKWLWVPQNSGDMQQKAKRGYTQAQIKREYDDIASEYDDIASAMREEIKVMKRVGGEGHIVNCEDYELIPRREELGWDILIKMELLVSLPDYFHQTMTVGDVIDLGVDICDALAICEREGIIHRDIKPDNIFVTKSGSYKLGDFGVAKQLELAESRMSKQGTPLYMAPEVYQGIAKAEHSVDTYSLGLVLHELLNRQRMPLVSLTDEMPKHAEREAALEARIAGTPVPPPVDGSVELKKVVCKACEYKAAKRYRTAKEMRKALLDAKKSTKLNETLTSNPILGVGPNSKRSELRRKSKGRAGSEKRAQDDALTETVYTQQASRSRNKTAVRQKGSGKRWFAVAAVFVLVVASVWAGLLIKAKDDRIEPVFESEQINAQQVEDTQTVTATELIAAAVSPAVEFTLPPTSSPAQTAMETAAPTPTPTPSPTPSPTPTSTPVPITALTAAATCYQFTDAGIEALARHTLSKQADEGITTEEWQNVTEMPSDGVIYYGPPIESFEDLRQCHSLVSLDVAYVKTNDFSPLQGLSGLQSLGLYDSVISDISSLAELTQLTYLWILQTEIHSIEGMQSMYRLGTLGLPYCGIKDVTPLADLQNLQSLFLLCNEIEDTSPLYALKKRGVEIELRGNPTQEVLEPTVAPAPNSSDTLASTLADTLTPSSTPTEAATSKATETMENAVVSRTIAKGNSSIIIDSENVTFQLYVPKLPDTFELNKEKTKVGDVEYWYEVSFIVGESKYAIAAVHFKNAKEDKPKTTGFEGLQSDLWRESKNESTTILGVRAVVNDNTITWTIPVKKLSYPPISIDVNEIMIPGGKVEINDTESID